MKAFGKSFTAILLAVLAFTPKALAEFADPVVWDKVFHHICEHSQLARVQIQCPIRNSELLGEGQNREIFLIGGYRFFESRIYLELYPAPGADEIWIIDGKQAFDADSFPRLIARLKVANDRLTISDPSGKRTYFPKDPGREIRLGLIIEGGVFEISPFMRASVEDSTPRVFSLDIPDGVYLGYPVPTDPSAGCGPPGLDIFLREAEAPLWPIEVAETALEVTNPTQEDSLGSSDNWESVSFRNYKSRSFYLLICGANSESDVEPTTGATLKILPPRDVLGSDKLLAALSDFTENLLFAEEMYKRVRPYFAKVRHDAPRVGGGYGSELRPKLELDPVEAMAMEEVGRLLQTTADGLAAFDTNATKAPGSTMGQLSKASNLAIELASGANDGYGYDLDILGQRIELAKRYLVIWAQNQFR